MSLYERFVVPKLIDLAMRQRRQARGHGQLGRLHLDTGRLESADQHFRQGIDMARRVGDERVRDPAGMREFEPRRAEPLDLLARAVKERYQGQGLAEDQDRDQVVGLELRRCANLSDTQLQSVRLRQPNLK